MRVLICGGRSYYDAKRLADVLQDFEYNAGKKIETVITGDATGADRLARDWAKDKGVKLEVFYADWDNENMFAVSNRNKRMLVEGKPQIVIAFPGGKGTVNMIRQAKDARVDVVEVP